MCCLPVSSAFAAVSSYVDAVVELGIAAVKCARAADVVVKDSVHFAAEES